MFLKYQYSSSYVFVIIYAIYTCCCFFVDFCTVHFLYGNWSVSVSLSTLPKLLLKGNKVNQRKLMQYDKLIHLKMECDHRNQSVHELHLVYIHISTIAKIVLMKISGMKRKEQ